MEHYYLTLFLLNTVLILVDASVGYHMAPLMLAGINDPEAAEAGVKTTRKLLSVVVALYMFFNCTGYFQMRMPYLLTVSGLIAVDMALQFYLRYRRNNTGSDSGNDED